MRAEVNVFGVFFSSLLAFAVVAWVLTGIATRLLAWVGFYRLVWHRALFDLALFVAVWGVTAAVGGWARVGSPVW